MAAPREQAPQPAQQPPPDHAVLTAIIVLLLAGLALDVLARRLALLLAPLGIPAAAVAGVLGILGTPGISFSIGPSEPDASPPGPAAAMLGRSGVARRAMYILAATRRLTSGEALNTERRLYEAHRRAEQKRLAAAGAVDDVAGQFGAVLGWHARMDDRTTPECRRAHGNNFLAAVPPLIGWPGTRHAGNCRCVPGRPWSDGEMLA